MGTTSHHPTRRRRAWGAARALPLAAALVIVAACGGDDDGATDTTAAAGTGAGDGVTVEGFAFTPASLTVPAGTTVVWTNKDGAEHTVVGTELSGQLAPGGTYEKRFDTAGTYTYACTIHPTMTGSITVT